MPEVDARRAKAAAARGPVWEATDLEVVIDGYLARVTRTSGPRWRWVVAPFDLVVKWNRGPADIPQAKGYCGTRERAQEMAEAAIQALKVADAGLTPGGGDV